MLDKTQCPFYTINYSEDFEKVVAPCSTEIADFVDAKIAAGKTLEEGEWNSMPPTQLKRYWISETDADECVAFMKQIVIKYGHNFNVIKYPNPEFIA